MNTKQMIEVMQAYEDGKQIELRPKGATCWHDCPLEPVWSWDDTEYRIKATKKPVDLSVLIDSGLDCEFCDIDADDQWHRIGKLRAISESSTPYWLDKIGNFLYCRPRMNHIHAWVASDWVDDNKCPLPEGIIVEAFVTDGIMFEHWRKLATDLSWGCNDQITVLQFQVIGLADGYCYPWECDNAAS